MGALIMIIGVVLMIVIHEGGHFLAAKAYGMKATEAFFGFGPKLWSMTRGETEYGVKAIPFGGYVRIIGMNPFEEIEPDEEGRTYRAASYTKKTVVVLAGIMSHFVMALILLWIVGVAWGTIAFDESGDPILTTEINAVSATVPNSTSESPAKESGAEPGDVIISADGQSIGTWMEFTDFAAVRPGEEVAIGVDRNGTEMTLTATLAVVDRQAVDATGKPIVDADGQPVTYEAGFYGVTPEPVRDSQGPISMIPIAFEQFGEAAWQSLRGLWELVISFPELIASLFGGNEEILDEVRPISPIGLARVAGPLQTTLQLLALVNIFVGVLNFVPLYPLDGGHFAVATYEKVTGREPNVQKLVPVAAVVFIFLVSLGLMGVYLDIFKPL